MQAAAGKHHHTQRGCWIFHHFSCCFNQTFLTKTNSFSLKFCSIKIKIYCKPNHIWATWPSLDFVQINNCPYLTQKERKKKVGRACSSVTLCCVKVSECVGGDVQHGTVCGRGKETEREKKEKRGGPHNMKISSIGWDKQNNLAAAFVSKCIKFPRSEYDLGTLLFHHKTHLYDSSEGGIWHHHHPLGFDLTWFKDKISQ